MFITFKFNLISALCLHFLIHNSLIFRRCEHVSIEKEPLPWLAGGIINLDRVSLVGLHWILWWKLKLVNLKIISLMVFILIPIEVPPAFTLVIYVVQRETLHFRTQLGSHRLSHRFRVHVLSLMRQHSEKEILCSLVIRQDIVRFLILHQILHLSL